MIEIDGSFGEGGGQILRTGLSLSALTGQAVHFTHIRAARRKPGLMRQHLLAAQVVSRLCGGVLRGDELSSSELSFQPGVIRGGAYRAAVGSAGSAVLIAQTALPVLLKADTPSELTVEGGTHVPMAPIFEFFDQVYLPCLRRMGAEVTATLDRVGFYPAGGGRITLNCRPVHTWKPLELLSRGRILELQAVALGHDIGAPILADELSFIRAALSAAGEVRCTALQVDSSGPGNAAFVRVRCEGSTELFSACGGYDVSRETVGRGVGKQAADFLGSEEPVGRCLADQLLLPMAVGAGGIFRTVSSQHTWTNLEVIRRFLPVSLQCRETSPKHFAIEVNP